MDFKLAIVIPAYKANYFRQTLQSIANQTCKDFILYIGDDAGPDDIESVVRKYSSQIQIVYKKFTKNLGSENLVAQWERCIDMAEDNEWIWLFSDDDMMHPTCVENFYSILRQYPENDLFHFNIELIDENNESRGVNVNYPDILTSEQFLIQRLEGVLQSFAVEYIFRKSLFIEQGRFQHFDLAWGSDDATWIKLGKNKGIRTIPDSPVYWRKSPLNISSVYRDKNILVRKLNARIKYADWVINRAESKGLDLDTKVLKNKLSKWFIRFLKNTATYLPYNVLSTSISLFYKPTGNKYLIFLNIFFFYFYKTYHLLVDKIKKSLLNKRLS